MIFWILHNLQQVNYVHFEVETNNLKQNVLFFVQRRPTSIIKCQSVSTFSSENLSVSDGEEGHTTDHSHSGTPDVVSTNTDDRLDDRSDDLLSQGSEIPADNTDPAQASDGLSEREGGLGQAKAQLDAGQNPNEVLDYPIHSCSRIVCLLSPPVM